MQKWLLSTPIMAIIVIKTFDDKAPETVKNFLDYCREGFYDNTIFHRVINGFMIQGRRF
ncbi:peptidyl-prolyl cis-trans isomerase B [Klebsiella pneumoniae]|uniref:Peptidyl-prolyl cis-trans isomerase n=1 Tax=Klebsiella pneumoniae TaxID=573 RepID=A0A377UV51_KLEPN|nr:peptidyl-prolyl cis-trans isomerase B [Klebsiella pneumoniae]